MTSAEGVFEVHLAVWGCLEMVVCADMNAVHHGRSCGAEASLSCAKQGCLHQLEVLWQGSVEGVVLTCMLCARATTGARTDGADRGPISIDGEMRWASCMADRTSLRCRKNSEDEQCDDKPCRKAGPQHCGRQVSSDQLLS